MKIIQTSLIVLAVIGVGIHVVRPLAAPTSDDKVKQACQYSSSACAQAEQKYGKKYLCDGLEAESHCWVQDYKSMGYFAK